MTKQLTLEDIATKNIREELAIKINEMYARIAREYNTLRGFRDPQITDLETGKQYF